ncbi:MAG TPA: hypothetical protein VK752_00160 [Bryobacteraceae bacterium]|jgi:hypothetical protein|nr:hypothetical protein [Bryobacteraceae bacterium]
MKYALPLLAAICLNAQTADPWKPLQFLTGEWIGETADSAGACSFALDLDRKVLIRKSYAQYATSRHEDLMVIYLEQDTKAIYFDSEGHVIQYRIEAGPDSVRFLNEQYRLTYRKDGERLAMDFEIAAPGKPFTNYLHAVLRRK